MTAAERHAQRLLRWYPRIWRAQHGDDFAALLIDDITERPRALARDFDVVRAGLLARLSACGLARGPVQQRSAIAAAGTAAAVGFVGSGLSIWTQLANGWLIRPPDTNTATVSFVALSIWLGGALLLAAVACWRIGVAVVRSWRTLPAAVVLRPLAMLATSCAVLVTGVILMSSRWPGASAGHERGALASATRIGWATTDAISTYWLHPSRLLALSGIELAWMALSPIAVAAFGWSLVRLLRVVPWSSPGAPRHRAAGVFFAGVPAVFSAVWVVSSQHASNASYRAGTLDLVLIALMLAAVRIGHNALRAATS